MRIVHAVAAAIVVTAVIIALGLGLSKGPSAHEEKGLFIVASIEPLAADAALIACSDDKVDYIIPRGADPHTYQLRPGDYSKLEQADILILMGGLDVEAGIARLAAQGELGANVLVILELPSVKVLVKPDGVANTHFPVYDPENYLAFLKALRDALVSQRPSCAAAYDSSFREVETRLEGLLARCSKALEGMQVVVDVPPAQYAIEWTGARVAAILQSEPGRPLSPGEVESVNSMLHSGLVDFVVITVGADGEPVSRAGEWLLQAAHDAGVPVVRVPAPFAPGSTMDKIEAVAEGVAELLGVCGG